MKVIYILGLGHSGSTILDLTLSRFSDVLGLGELRKVLKRPGVLNIKDETSSEKVCACDQYISQCSFWSTVPEIVDGRSMYDNYRKFFEFLNDGRGFRAVVDSSKNLAAFEVLVRLEQEQLIDLYPVLLLRDVRGWISSARHTDRRNRRRPKSYPYYTLQWYRRSRDIQRFLVNSGRGHYQLSYEEFCFDWKNKASKIREYAGLPTEKISDGLGNAHGLFGNRSRRVSGQDVIYDRRWFREVGANLWPLLLPPVLIWNMKNVYGNWD